MPTLLALDTATQSGSVALCHNGKLVSRFALMPRQHSAQILPFIDSCLNELGVALTDIDAIAFTQGPGSFMGVRLATGIAQGLAFGAQLPVIPLSTLQVLAQTAYEECRTQRVLAAWDARMQGLYWGGYELNQQGVMEVVIADQLTAADQFIWPESQWDLVGNAWDVYREVLGDTTISQCRHQLTDLYPHATAMITLALQAWEAGLHQQALSVEPIYLRDTVVQS